jgi:NAD(P)H dehydrogenase (quinone)
MTIAVSGATGQMGSRVARLLAAAGENQRLIVRDPTRLAVPGDHEIAIIGAYDDAEGMSRALTGAGTALMVSGMEAPDRLDQHRAFVDAAVDAEVGHLVYTSYYGASPTAIFDHARLHWETEQYIEASGLPYTFLRDNLYADYLPYLAGEDGVIRGPGGNGRVSAVSQDDIAEVAVAVLRNPAAHAGHIYDLTGPEGLSLAEVAAILTARIGRQISYHDETLEEALESRAKFGAERWLVDAWISTYTAIAAGEMDGVSNAVRLITGHQPTSLDEALRRKLG